MFLRIPQRLTHAALPLLVATGMCTTLCHADSVSLVSARDNTLIEEKNGSLSNGAGFGVFAGRVGDFGFGLCRRAVLWFDVAGNVPPGSTIQSVTLTMTVTQANSGQQTFTVHRLLNDWGEGKSFSFGGSGDDATRDDATWLHTHYPDQYWNTPGGDYVRSVSATASVGNAGPIVFGSTDDLVADVQSWIDDPAGDFGWMIRGNENFQSTVKRFASREWNNRSERPTLVIQFDPSLAIPGDLDGDGVVGATDLAYLLGSWGPCPPPAACVADIDEDGYVTAADLAILLGNWS